MAIYILYEKFRETDSEVEYHYGSSKTELNERLVIDKSGPGGELKDPGGDPRTAGDVVGRILYNLHKQGVDLQAKIVSWPDAGAIQA